MIINYATKTIKALTWEMPQVQNYLSNVVPQNERKEWKVNFIKNEVELRKKVCTKYEK